MRVGKKGVSNKTDEGGLQMALQDYTIVNVLSVLYFICIHYKLRFISSTGQTFKRLKHAIQTI